MKMNFIIGLKLHAADRKIIAICHLSIPVSVLTIQTKHNFFSTKHVILHAHLCDSSKVIWFGYIEVIYMYLQNYPRSKQSISREIQNNLKTKQVYFTLF